MPSKCFGGFYKNNYCKEHITQNIVRGCWLIERHNLCNLLNNNDFCLYGPMDKSVG